MLQVSLHGIKLIASHGLYPQEHILGNHFEVDVDVTMPDTQPWPYVDYTMIRSVVATIFDQPGQLLETFVYNIHAELKMKTPNGSTIRVAVRKMHPPMPGDVAFAQVCYEA